MNTATATKPETNGKNISNLVYLKFDIASITIDTDSSIRHEYDQEKLQELAESIKQNNNDLLQPILISKIADKDKSEYLYKVIAGRRRFLACKDILKLDKISAIIKEYDSFESEFMAQFAENEERENWTDYDYVKAINLLKAKTLGISQAQLAKIFNKTIDWVKKKQQHINLIADLPESATSHLSTTIVAELGKLKPEEKTKVIQDLAELAKEGKELPSVRELRKDLSQRKTVRPKEGMVKVFALLYDVVKEELYLSSETNLSGTFDKLKKISTDNIDLICKDIKVKKEDIYRIYKVQYSAEYQKSNMLWENPDHPLIKKAKTENLIIEYFNDDYEHKKLNVNFPYLKEFKLFTNLKDPEDFIEDVFFKMHSDENDLEINEYGNKFYKITGKRVYFHNKEFETLITPNKEGFLFYRHQSDDICVNAKQVFSVGIENNSKLFIAYATDGEKQYIDSGRDYSGKKNSHEAYFLKGNKQDVFLNSISKLFSKSNYNFDTKEIEKIGKSLFVFIRKEFPDFEKFDDAMLILFFQTYKVGYTIEAFQENLKKQIKSFKSEISEREISISTMQNFLTASKLGSEVISSYEAWKKTGKVSAEAKKEIINFLRERQTTVNTKYTTSQKSLKELEKDKTDISNDIALLEDELLIPADNKARKAK